MKRAALVFLVVLLLTPLVPAQTPEEKKATLAYVAKLRNPDGGFSPDALTKQSSLRATSSAVRLYKYFGQDLADPAAVSQFVEGRFDKGSGGFADAPGTAFDVATTAVGLMAVKELKLADDPYQKSALNYLNEHVKSFDDVRIAVAGLEAVEAKPNRPAAWIDIVKKTANADGTYGKGGALPRDTGSAVVALMRLGVKVDNKEAVLKTLNDGQFSDGGFGVENEKRSDLESTYRVLRCYHMLKSKPPNADRLAAFVASCRNEDGGYGVLQGAKSTLSATYYAASILHWLAEK